MESLANPSHRIGLLGGGWGDPKRTNFVTPQTSLSPLSPFITWVKKLELLVCIATIHNVEILLFEPVHISRLCSQPEICSSELYST